MKMGSKLKEKEVREYSELVDEFSDTFAWSHDELKGIPREMVEHRIPLIPGAKPIRQKERIMNPQLQLLVKAELERLLKAGFIKPVEITDWVSPMVLVKKKFGKLRVCVDYRKLNACTQNDHFSLPFITLLLEEVGGHARHTFMDGYAGYNQILIALQDIHKTVFTTTPYSIFWEICLILEKYSLGGVNLKCIQWVHFRSTPPKVSLKWETVNLPKYRIWCSTCRGSFVWVVIPFGLCNAPATFQQLVMYIFTDLLYKSMTVFIDDFSTQSYVSDHLHCVRETLVRYRMMRLALNPDKTFLEVNRGVLLG